MFIGHFAVGFASKRFAPRTPLSWLLVAPMFLDVVWPVLVLVGVEQAAIEPDNTAFTRLDLAYMPWSHSLVMAVVWSVAFAVGYRLWANDRRGAAVLGVGVFSHWVLDWLTHLPDLGIAPGLQQRVGLGLWNSVPGTLALELAIFGLGVVTYARVTRANTAMGHWSLWTLVAAMLASYFGAAFGPPPPSIVFVTTSALVGTGLFVAWAVWIDRTRRSRAASSA